MWSWVGDWASSGSEAEEEEEVVMEFDRERRRGDVCVPAERLKKRAPSSGVVESVSESSSSTSS